ncbi:ESCO2 acetyltransferase, partial [Jacana jacana]|nr:ESCO2 acetyltransferase [Jacana jacana]
YQPLVPVVSFYSKEKRYLTPLERKELNENRWLRERSGDGNPPAASRTEKMNLSSRNPCLKPPKHGKTLPKSHKKGKGDVLAGKPSGEKENVNTLIKKKMDSPFRVLSMTVKPALKLQLGAAFFSARKKSHSKKPVGDAKPLQEEPKSLQENAHPPPPPTPKSDSADQPPVLEAGRVLRSISVPQERGNANREDSTSFSFCPGINPLNLQDGEAVGSSTSQEEWADCLTLACQSPPQGKKPAPPSNAVVYPIFSAPPPASKKRPQAALDELTPPFGSSPASQKSKKARELCRGSRDQMIIDAGQKHFGAVVCKSCGMIYTAGSPEDEAQHIQHHERFLEALRYVGWKKERVVAEFWDGKIVLILPADPKYAVKKVHEDVREIVDNELGFKQVSLSCPAKTKIYLFVSNMKIIVGCLVAESIKQAFRVLAEPGAALSPEEDALQPQRPWRCSTEPEPAVCGISRIWVFGPRRGTGIARRMVDVLRSTFMYGCVLSPQEIAFSDPTPDGKLFATKYCQTPSFLVYNFLSNN